MSKVFGIALTVAGLLVGMLAGVILHSHHLSDDKAEVTNAPQCPQCPLCETPSANVRMIETRVAIDSGTTAAEKCSSAERNVAELSNQLAVMDQRLAQVTAQLENVERQRAQLEGKAATKPANLLPRYEQEPLQRAFDAALKELGMNATVTSMDCTEYPCIVYGQGMGGRADFEKLDQSKAMSDYASSNSMKWMWTGPGADGRPTRFFGVSILPKDGPYSWDDDKRINFRVDEMKKATESP